MAVTWVVRLADCRHERVLIGFLRGPHPHPFQRRVHLRSPEAHRPADLEIGDQPKLRPGKVMERFTMQHRRWLRSVFGVSSLRSMQIIFLTFFEAGFWAWSAGPGRWGFLAGREILGRRGRAGRAGDKGRDGTGGGTPRVLTDDGFQASAPWWRRRSLASAGGLRRASSGALKRSFISSREAAQKGVRPLLEASRKPGQSWSTMVWMRLAVAVCSRIWERRQRVSSRRSA